MQAPISTLFSSQLTEPEKNITKIDADDDDDDDMVSFSDLQFNPEEEDIFDELIMSGK